MDDLLSQERDSITKSSETLKFSLLCVLILLIVEICSNNPFLIQYAQSGIFQSMAVFSILANVAITLGLLIFISCFHSVSRKILLVGGVLVMVSIEGTMISIYMDKDQHEAFTFCLGLFYFFLLGATLLPMLVAFPVELLGGLPLSLVVASNYVMKLGMIMAMEALLVNNRQNLAYLSICGEVVCVIGVIVVILYFPETYSKTKAEILKRDSVLEGKDSLLSNQPLQSFQLRQEELE